MADADSRLLGGRYEVRSLIGRGGMAQVHLGRDTRLSRLVAIKILRVDLARDAVFQTRFRREAQAAASLNHPNIVAVYDTGEEPVKGADGKVVSVPYIVMEYVEGHTVKELLADSTPVPIPEAVEITSGVLSALQYAHSSGLVHRDIKPGNVMLTNSGKVKVMDFGIARALADSQATMTAANAVIGTAQYLSPEQARGEVVDERSDIYSAGCLLFELLTGQAPFNGENAVSLAYQHVSEAPPVPSSIASDVPQELDRVTLKALAKNPADRYASAADMEVDLVRASEGMPIQAPPLAAFAASATAQTELLGAAATTGVTQALDPVSQTMQYAGPTRTGAASATTTGTMSATTTGSVPAQTTAAKKKNKGLTFLVWMLVILAAAIVGFVIWYFTSQAKEPEVEMTLVPEDLVGMTQAEAKAAIVDAGLLFSLDDSPVMDANVEKGLVAETNPPSGEEIEVGKTVVVRLSGGPSQEPVPNLVNMSVEQAQQMLSDAGFELGAITQSNEPGYKANTVIRSDPAAGTTQPKGTTINITTASGLVELPSGLVGATQAAVTSQLQDLGFKPVIVTEQSETVAQGNVISIYPNGVLPQGSEITVTVSSGPPPEPEPEPEPTPEPTPNPAQSS